DRLACIVLTVPPLRERDGDLRLLIDHFVTKHAGEHHRRLRGLDPQALALVERYGWPGNVRELEQAVIRAVVFATGPWITAKDLRIPVEAAANPTLSPRQHDIAA